MFHIPVFHIKGPGWPDRGGWYAVALFAQTIFILCLMVGVPDLRKDEFFKSLANAIIITGWIGFAVGQAKGEKERDNTSKALDLAKGAAPSSTDQMDVAAEKVTVNGKTKS